MCSSGVMKSQIKLLSHKTCNTVILDIFFIDKATKEVVSAMDIIITSFPQEIIRLTKCQMMF